MKLYSNSEWNNSCLDELPTDGQQVVISVEHVNYISVYDADKKIFRVDEMMETFFKVKEKMILWKEIFSTNQ